MILPAVLVYARLWLVWLVPRLFTVYSVAGLRDLHTLHALVCLRSSHVAPPLRLRLLPFPVHTGYHTGFRSAYHAPVLHGCAPRAVAVYVTCRIRSGLRLPFAVCYTARSLPTTFTVGYRITTFTVAVTVPVPPAWFAGYRLFFYGSSLRFLLVWFGCLRHVPLRTRCGLRLRYTRCARARAFVVPFAVAVAPRLRLPYTHAHYTHAFVYATVVHHTRLTPTAVTRLHHYLALLVPCHDLPVTYTHTRVCYVPRFPLCPVIYVCSLDCRTRLFIYTLPSPHYAFDSTHVPHTPLLRSRLRLRFLAVPVTRLRAGCLRLRSAFPCPLPSRSGCVLGFWITFTRLRLVYGLWLPLRYRLHTGYHRDYRSHGLACLYRLIRFLPVTPLPFMVVHTTFMLVAVYVPTVTQLRTFVHAFCRLPCCCLPVTLRSFWLLLRVVPCGWLARGCYGLRVARLRFGLHYVCGYRILPRSPLPHTVNTRYARLRLYVCPFAVWFAVYALFRYTYGYTHPVCSCVPFTDTFPLPAPTRFAVVPHGCTVTVTRFHTPFVTTPAVVPTVAGSFVYVGSAAGSCVYTPYFPVIRGYCIYVHALLPTARLPRAFTLPWITHAVWLRTVCGWFPSWLVVHCRVLRLVHPPTFVTFVTGLLYTRLRSACHIHLPHGYCTFTRALRTFCHTLCGSHGYYYAVTCLQFSLVTHLFTVGSTPVGWLVILHILRFAVGYALRLRLLYYRHCRCYLRCSSRIPRGLYAYRTRLHTTLRLVCLYARTAPFALYVTVAAGCYAHAHLRLVYWLLRLRLVPVYGYGSPFVTPARSFVAVLYTFVHHAHGYWLVGYARLPAGSRLHIAGSQLYTTTRCLVAVRSRIAVLTLYHGFDSVLLVVPAFTVTFTGYGLRTVACVTAVLPRWLLRCHTVAHRALHGCPFAVTFTCLRYLVTAFTFIPLYTFYAVTFVGCRLHTLPLVGCGLRLPRYAFTVVAFCTLPCRLPPPLQVAVVTVGSVLRVCFVRTHRLPRLLVRTPALHALPVRLRFWLHCVTLPRVRCGYGLRTRYVATYTHTFIRYHTFAIRDCRCPFTRYTLPRSVTTHILRFWFYAHTVLRFGYRSTVRGYHTYRFTVRFVLPGSVYCPVL